MDRFRREKCEEPVVGESYEIIAILYYVYSISTDALHGSCYLLLI